MGRIFSILFLGTFICLMLYSTITGIQKSNKISNIKTTFSPSKVYMAKHLKLAHGITIGIDNSYDIIAKFQDNNIKIIFTQKMLQKYGQECLGVLQFNNTSKTLSKKEYLTFLDMLHAYLSVSPFKKRKK
jgi:hypothetical protein